MTKYYVTIEPIVRKTLEIDADSREEAIEQAHGEFSLLPEDGSAEYYEEQTVNVREG